MVAIVPGLTGRLISSSFAYDLLPTLDGYVPVPAVSARAIARAVDSSVSTLGPSSGVRAITDTLLVPLLRALGFVAARLDNRVHRLTLRVKRPGMTVRGRRSYLASGDDQSSGK